MRIVKASYEIIDIPDGKEVLKKIERCARICYKSEDHITAESAETFLSGLLSKDPPHMSVFEHAFMTVHFICDRGVTHELVRHRLASYSQESTRYCNYSKGKYGNEITVIKPCFWDEKSIEYIRWVHSCESAESFYICLTQSHSARPERARSVLPNSLKTEIITSANLRQWGHIFFQRTSKRAHPQMREIMVPLLAEVRERIPILYDNLEVYR